MQREVIKTVKDVFFIGQFPFHTHWSGIINLKCAKLLAHATTLHDSRPVNKKCAQKHAEAKPEIKLGTILLELLEGKRKVMNLYKGNMGWPSSAQKSTMNLF